MVDKDDEETLFRKILFYTTAFFVLLGIFSLFSFLFLVPFVIDPAFTTIFMEFDETPVICVTVKTFRRMGVSNCSWTSCREGCTKDIYDCTQILVNYTPKTADVNLSFLLNPDSDIDKDQEQFRVDQRQEFSLDIDNTMNIDDDDDNYHYESFSNDEQLFEAEPRLVTNSKFGWYYREARLLPNVKGCGYPPSLNCSKFLKNHKEIGKNYSCYYSRVDPSIVISHLDMWQVYKNLVYALAIPIPSFILSIVYLAVAYFKIYSEDEERAPLKSHAEEMDVHDENMQENNTEAANSTGGNQLQLVNGESITPGSETFREDLASFGHQFKVAMVDEVSHDSLNGLIPTSSSIGENLSKAMTTSISTTDDPIVDM